MFKTLMLAATLAALVVAPAKAQSSPDVGSVLKQVGCGSPISPADTKNKKQIEEANKKIVDRYWKALAARNWDGMKALLTEDAHYTDVGLPGPGGTGPEGVVARVQGGLEDLENYEHLPGAIMIADGNVVMTEHIERWTFRRGESLEHKFVSVTELRDGKICRWHDYSNIANIIDRAPAWWKEKQAKKQAAQASAGKQ